MLKDKNNTGNSRVRKKFSKKQQQNGEGWVKLEGKKKWSKTFCFQYVILNCIDYLAISTINFVRVQVYTMQ